MRKKSFTVLCVDGDGFGLQLRRMVLESFGCKVTAHTSGTEALASLAERNFDIVVMDHSVDGIAGDELARQIKAAQPQLAILMLTSLAYPPDHMLPYIDGFATTGDWPQDLMNTIEKTIRGSRIRDNRSARSRWLGNLAVSGARLLARALDHRGQRAEPAPEGQAFKTESHQERAHL